MPALTGRERKQLTMDAFEAARPRLLLAGRLAMLRVLLDRGTCTMDDVRELVPVPYGVSPAAFGGVPHALFNAGIITRDGYRPTGRAEAKDRPVAVWRLVDRAAAECWIATHAKEYPHAQPV